MLSYLVDNPCHHLGLHTNAKHSLSNVFTADWQKYFDSNVTKSDQCFIAVAERVLFKHYSMLYLYRIRELCVHKV